MPTILKYGAKYGVPMIFKTWGGIWGVNGFKTWGEIWGANGFKTWGEIWGADDFKNMGCNMGRQY